MAKDYLNDIWLELAKGRIEERQLQEHRPKRKGKKAIRGWCDGESVVVNHIPDICDTLIHELFHRRFPDWSEKYVKARTTLLIRSMSPEQQLSLYNEYMALKQEKRKLTVED